MDLRSLGKYSILPLRLILGLVFIYHGYSKLFGSIGIDGFTGMLTGLGVPLAMFFAVLVALIEFVGGISVLVGFKVQYAAFLLGVVMVFAILLVKLKMGWAAMEIDLSLLAMSISLLLSGPGSKFVLKR